MRVERSALPIRQVIVADDPRQAVLIALLLKLALPTLNPVLS